jgi:hypothetical protein
MRMAVTTTLFDLFAALHEDITPGDEDLVIATVRRLCESGCLRFLSTPCDDKMAVHARFWRTRRETHVA